MTTDLDAVLLANDGRTVTLRSSRNGKALERTFPTSELENIINDNEHTVLEEFGLSPYRAKIALDCQLRALRNPAAAKAERVLYQKMLAGGQRSQPLPKVEPSTRSGAEWRTLASGFIPCRLAFDSRLVVTVRATVAITWKSSGTPISSSLFYGPIVANGSGVDSTVRPKSLPQVFTSERFSRGRRRSYTDLF